MKAAVVRITGVEPARREAQDPKSCVSANSTISAFLLIIQHNLFSVKNPIFKITVLKALRHFALFSFILIGRVILMKKLLYRTLNAKQFLFFAFIAVLVLAFVFGIDLFYSNKSVAVTKSELPLIIIDAGHGGEDGGTQSSTGVLEKDINLSVSKDLEAIFAVLGFKTISVRSDDELIYDNNCNTIREKKVSDIHNRMALIEAHPNSIFLSIHQNHYAESKYYGAQVFYSKNDSRSEIMAQSIQSSIVQKLQPENERLIKPSGTEIYLLYHAKIPAVMVECGFLSNPGEAQLLNDPDYQKKIALAIADGVIKYLSN